MAGTGGPISVNVLEPIFGFRTFLKLRNGCNGHYEPYEKGQRDQNLAGPRVLVRVVVCGRRRSPPSRRLRPMPKATKRKAQSLGAQGKGCCDSSKGLPSRCPQPFIDRLQHDPSGRAAACLLQAESSRCWWPQWRAVARTRASTRLRVHICVCARA